MDQEFSVEQVLHAPPGVVGGCGVVGGSPAAEESVGHARVGDDLVAYPGRAQRLGDFAPVFWWDDLVFFADEDEQATGDLRCAGQGRLGAAQRDVGGGEPAAVDDGDGGQVELGGG